jgi:hypothetical protein
MKNESGKVGAITLGRCTNDRDGLMLCWAHLLLIGPNTVR